MKIFSCHFPEGPNKKRERENRKKVQKVERTFFSFLPPPLFRSQKCSSNGGPTDKPSIRRSFYFRPISVFPSFFKGKGSAVPFFPLEKSATMSDSTPPSPKPKREQSLPQGLRKKKVNFNRKRETLFNIWRRKFKFRSQWPQPHELIWY